ncbi:MAG TPA: hypothetical protein VF680_07745 [Allosphingosinicella sp.]|jgi:hypothetical protein
MGFAGKSGSSATALGSARQYGLVEGIGEKTRISDLALRIFEPSSPAERAEALKDAASEPNVFKAIFERFDNRVPASDEPIRAFLIRELGFSPSGAEDCIEAFRATNLELEQATTKTTAVAVAPTRSQITDDRERLREHEPIGDFIRLPLTRDCTVELRFSGQVSDRAIANLISHIELMQDVWSER